LGHRYPWGLGRNYFLIGKESKVLNPTEMREVGFIYIHGMPVFKVPKAFVTKENLWQS
jgi:hypothetical protein